MGAQNCDWMLPLPEGVCLVAVMHTGPQDRTGRINTKVNFLCTRLSAVAGREASRKIFGGDQFEVFVVAWIRLVTADWKGRICRTADRAHGQQLQFLLSHVVKVNVIMALRMTNGYVLVPTRLPVN